MTVFLTGATGFVGMEVLVRLLDETDEPVAALVRGGPERLDAAMDMAGVPAGLRGRVRAVSGDLTSPLPDVGGDVTSVVHCAASVSWALTLEEARAINVAGTQRVLELASGLPALERFVHVSTAYVAGRWSGRFSESDLLVGQDFRNTYEQAKAEAEAMVQDSGLPVTVVRPSIVVGESDSGWTPAFNVIYWPLRAFARGLLNELPALPHSHVDIVPVDYVADVIVHALRCDDPLPVWNATSGADAVTVDRLVELASAAMGRDRPGLVAVGSEIAGGSDQVSAYLEYFDMEVVFDDALSRARLGFGPPALEAYFGRLISFAERARWGKRPVSRAEARAGLERSAA